MMEFSDALFVIRTYGPAFCAVVFFLWRDYRREGAMTRRITGLEDETRKIIIPLVEKCSAVIAYNSSVMEQLEKILGRRKRPLAAAKPSTKRKKNG